MSAQRPPERQDIGRHRRQPAVIDGLYVVSLAFVPLALLGWGLARRWRTRHRDDPDRARAVQRQMWMGSLWAAGWAGALVLIVAGLVDAWARGVPLQTAGPAYDLPLSLELGIVLAMGTQVGLAATAALFLIGGLWDHLR